jgi:N-acetylneuraminic acid mutarotase
MTRIVLIVSASLWIIPATLCTAQADSNVALAQNGGVASSSATYPSLQLWTINDGRRGSPYDLSIAQYAYWASSTSATVYNCNYGNWWTRVDFIVPREISEIDLFSLQDDYWTGTEPTTSTVTHHYGNVDFHLQYCPQGTTCSADGSGWVQPAGGYITGNDKARNSVSFAPVQATAVQAVFDCAQSAHAYAVELEAWQRGPTPPVEAGIPTWTTTTLSTARWDHTATLLSSGRVLVAGGISGTSLSSTDLYDPSTGTWSPGASLTIPRGSHTATLLPSGKVLVVGGTSNGENGASVSTAELYDPDTNTWSSTASLTTARKKHTATLLPSGKVLVVGGTSLSWGQSLSSAELYDPSTGTWSSAGSLATRRYDHTATLLPSGKVLVVGGWGPYADSVGTDLPTAELYDPDTDSWSSTGNLASGRRVPTATLLPSGKVLVAGGITSWKFTDTAELYDPTTGTWSTAGWLNTARGYHTATLLPSGKVLVTGGRGPYATVNETTLFSTELYDPATNLWSSTVSLPSPRNNHTATLLSSSAMLVVGGLYNGVPVASAAVFGSPPTPADVKSDIEVGYLNPQLHTVTKSPVAFSRGADQVIVWDRKFDGVDLLTDARSEQLPDGSWKTRFLRELSAPDPVRQADVWTFQNAALAVGLDPNKVRARLVYSPNLAQSRKVPNPTNATDVELVVNSYRLAIELVDDDTMTITYVDAYTGQYIEAVPQEMHTAVPTMRYGTVNLDATGPLVLRDFVRASLFNASLVPINGQGLVSAKPVDLTSELTYLPLLSTADYTNDIAYGLQQSWDYYLAKFGRRGLRDLPRSTTATANDAIVYFRSSAVPNLGMHPPTGVITVYRDAASKWQGFVTADVIGHEWSHAVWANDTQHGQPIYQWGSNGGINEANSDLFGELIEARAKALAGPPLQPDPNTIDDGWVIGQDSGSTGTTTTKRYMCTPSQSPGINSTLYDTWQPGFEDPTIKPPVTAHDAAGPLIRVFCLLGRGMLPDVSPNDPVLRSSIVPNGFPALGADTVGRLQYQAMVWLRAAPKPAHYLDQRVAMLNAAINLFGEYSPEYKAVQDAFAVVGVSRPADRAPPIITLTSGLVLGTSQPIEVAVVPGNPISLNELGALASNPITSVSFQLNGTALGMVTTAPWQVVPPKLAPGQYTLQVTAVDSHRNTATTSYVLTLQDTTVPELSEIMVGPSGGPAGELNVFVSDDVSGLSGLDIYQTGVGWVKSDYTPSPPKIERLLTFTKTFAPGTYTFQGYCGDQAGNSTQTVARSYTVGSPTPPCNTTAQAGTNVIDQRVWEMGKTSGNVTLTYQTFVVHDRIMVLYQGGVVIADTGCRATGDPASAVAQSFSYSGSSSQLTVRVEPNCDPQTAAPSTQWNYKLSCP